MKNYIISICGMMGSGKTTLAKNLSRKFGWGYVHESKKGLQFLVDLFKDEKRWAFDTQLSFLTTKAIHIINMIERSKDIIIDRSLDEDIYIFAEYFYRSGKIDARSYDTYRYLADYFKSKIQEPDLTIYCDCSLEGCKKRIEERNRLIDMNYPTGHIDNVFQIYNKWKEGLRATTSVYLVNSECYDFRDQQVISHIYTEIVGLLNATNQDQLQLEMFAPSAKITKNLNFTEILTPISPVVERGFNKRQLVIKENKQEIFTYPYAYIAAPFTAIATNESMKKSQNEKISLFNSDPPHGIISGGVYRSALTSISNKLKMLGINNVLPHRDVNAWGKKILMPKEVYEKCTDHVRNCDIFIGILGESNGSHYEFGLAIGCDKPSLIINCKEITTSFIANGIPRKENIYLLNCDTIKEIPRLFNNPDVRSFLIKWAGVGYAL